MRRTVFWALSVVFGLTVCASAAEKTVHKKFDVKQGGTLTVDADFGSVEVISGTADEVDVTVTFKHKGGDNALQRELEQVNLSNEMNGNDVQVILERKDKTSWMRGNRLQAHFAIRVPGRYNVHVNTSGGSISVDDLEGDVDVKTSGGSLKLGKIVGPVQGKTSGGSVTVEECKGTVDVHTSGGSITLGRVEGPVVAKTSGGSIHVEEVMGSIDAGTSGGSVTAKITKQPEADCALKTSGGTIRVSLEENIALNVEAGTSGGSVHTDFPVTVQGKINPHHLNAKINGGGPNLILKTSGGSIYIDKL